MKRQEELTSEELLFIKSLKCGSSTELFINKMKSGPQSPFKDKRCQEFLQNLQDSAYNSLRNLTKIGDELERTTEGFLSTENDDENLQNSQEEEEEEEDVLLTGQLLDELMGCLQQVDNTVINRMIPKKCSTLKIKEKGLNNCGFSNLASMKPAREKEEDRIEESRDDINAIDERPQENFQEIIASEQQSWLQIALDTSYKPPKDKNRPCSGGSNKKRYC